MRAGNAIKVGKATAAEMDKAATKIQASFRGFKARKKAKGSTKAAVLDLAEEHQVKEKAESAFAGAKRLYANAKRAAEKANAASSKTAPG